MTAALLILLQGISSAIQPDTERTPGRVNPRIMQSNIAETKPLRFAPL